SMVSRILCRGVHENQGRPVRIAMALRANTCGRRVARDLACRGHVVVAALTVCDEPRMVEARRAPRQGGVTVPARVGRREMPQRFGGCPHPGVATHALALL